MQVRQSLTSNVSNTPVLVAKNLGSVYKVTDGEHGSVVIQNFGIKYLTAENIKKGYVDISNVRYVNEIVDKKNARARVKSGDILISIKGTLGEIAVAEDWLLPANMNRDVAILKPLFSNCHPEFVAIFLMSKYGAIQSLRGGSGGVQQMITLERLRKFCISKLADNFCLTITNLYKNSQSLLFNSSKIYISAEALLLNALGMADFSPSTENINIKSFKNSFIATGRLDAEYYQPKYEDYQVHIFNYINGWDYLINCCNLKDSNYTPKEGKEYQYIELANINKSGGITDCTIAKGEELPSRARRKVKNGDVLISSIEGSLTSCAVVTKEFDSALCSTGFYIIDSNKINSETLLVLFKSKLMQNILKQSCSGTILTAMNKTEFSRLPIPIIAIKTQNKIATLIQQSFTLKARSEQLLATAKRAVELAIETNEQTALDYINEQSGEY